VKRALAILLLCSSAALCQTGKPEILKNVGIDQKLNEQIPLDLVFRDESGASVHLGDYFGKKPVVLSLVYYQCPMLCNMVLNGMLRAFRALSFDIGDQYEVVTVSFDPKENAELARAKHNTYIGQYRRPAANGAWHFLTGDEPEIKQLADAVGFHYAWDPAANQFAHASGIMVVTPDGRIARYFYGVEYSPNNLRLSLVEAARGKIGSPVDQLLLYCFHYDPAIGKYSMVIANVIKVAGVLTLLALITLVTVLSRRYKTPKVDYAC
jgi:protein SCO1/2